MKILWTIDATGHNDPIVSGCVCVCVCVNKF